MRRIVNAFYDSALFVATLFMVELVLTALFSADTHTVTGGLHRLLTINISPLYTSCGLASPSFLIKSLFMILLQMLGIVPSVDKQC